MIDSSFYMTGAAHSYMGMESHWSRPLHVDRGHFMEPPSPSFFDTPAESTSCGKSLIEALLFPFVVLIGGVCLLIFFFSYLSFVLLEIFLAPIISLIGLVTNWNQFFHPLYRNMLIGQGLGLLLIGVGLIFIIAFWFNPFTLAVNSIAAIGFISVAAITYLFILTSSRYLACKMTFSKMILDLPQILEFKTRYENEALEFMIFGGKFFKWPISTSYELFFPKCAGLSWDDTQKEKHEKEYHQFVSQIKILDKKGIFILDNKANFKALISYHDKESSFTKSKILAQAFLLLHDNNLLNEKNRNKLTSYDFVFYFNTACDLLKGKLNKENIQSILSCNSGESALKFAEDLFDRLYAETTYDTLMEHLGIEGVVCIATDYTGIAPEAISAASGRPRLPLQEKEKPAEQEQPVNLVISH